MVFDYVLDVVRGNRLIITFAYRCSTDTQAAVPDGEPDAAAASLHDDEDRQLAYESSDVEDDEDLVKAGKEAVALVHN